MSNHNEAKQNEGETEEEEEEDEEEEVVCDECGEIQDEPFMLNDDEMCDRCVRLIRTDEVGRKLPPNYQIREVSGNHRKPCSDCGKNDWFRGDYYVFDAFQPYGTDKYCLDCADNKEWGGSDDSDSEDERVWRQQIGFLNAMKRPGGTIPDQSPSSKRRTG